MGVSKGYQPNTFRAISGSLFSTAANWSRGYVPTGSDAAVIADNCTINISRIIGSLIVRPGVTASINGNISFQVNDTINSLGHISCSGNPTVISFAKKNVINSLSPASSSFIFGASGIQNIPGLTYYYLSPGTNDLGIANVFSSKFATGDITVLNNLSIGGFPGGRSTLNLGNYNLTVFGTTGVTSGILTKNQTGSLLFIGGYSGGGFSNNTDFSGNPTVEFRTGFAIGSSNPSPTAINSGIARWYFSTNPNQYIGTWASIFPSTIDAPILIGSGVNLLLRGSGFNPATDSGLFINSTINGEDATSKLSLSGSLYFNSIASLNSMSTGSFDFTSSATTVGFTGNYSATIPNKFANLRSVVISGTGTKALGTSSFFSGSLTNNTNGTFELGNHDLFVSGATNVGAGQSNIFRKSGPGNIIFGGEISRVGWNSGVGTFDLSGGNPNVECRGGMRTLDGSTFNSGFGTWSFAVNNQRLYLDNPGVASTLTFNSFILIKDGITLSVGNPLLTVIIRRNIDSATSTTTLTNSGSLFFESSSRSMTTGTLDITFPGNTIGYISSEPTQFLVYNSTYQNLYIANPGIKYATSSLFMSAGLSLANGGILDIGTFDMFVSGTCLLNSGSLIKTSSGNITFNGSLNTWPGSGGSTINISASNIELRGGMIIDYSPNLINTHSFYFTTNNQTITSSNTGTQPSWNNANFIISGAINLTISPAWGLSFTGYMDGTDTNSKLTIGRGPVPSSPGGGIVYYSSPIMPMATSGTLDASSSLNVFVYNGGAQDIKGGIYRNLTFSGGTKTLRGNVSVLNTLNTGSVTVNLNGFTLTNP